MDVDDVFKKALDGIKIKVAKSHPDFVGGKIAIIKGDSPLIELPYDTVVTMHTVHPATDMVLARIPRNQLHAVQEQFPDVRVVEPAAPEPYTGFVLVPTRGSAPPKPLPLPSPRPSPRDGWDPVKTEIGDPMGMVVLGRLDTLK